MGEKINNLLDRLPPRSAWLRANWGVTGSPGTNQHPSRGLRQLIQPELLPSSLWLRYKHITGLLEPLADWLAR